MMTDDLIRMHGAGKDRDFRRAALWTWLRIQLLLGRAIDVRGGSGYMIGRLLEAGGLESVEMRYWNTLRVAPLLVAATHRAAEA